ncbi:MAG: zinc ribbon domain-containing protein [Burkholderiales bacterium]|nr:zinc ribbon domain-containing protein [Burkholderiales bacterium]
MSRIFIVALAIFLLPALAAGQSSRSTPMVNPRLASLQIEIWPEYDRPAALVILKGELAADVPLPAAVALRIAAATGGPTAVAASTGPGAALFNLKHERKNADDFITVSFEAAQRLFHVEFYEPLATAKPERSYTYVWPGDFAVDRLHVILQEPAGALFVTAQPGLNATTTGQNGLRYRSAELGAQKAGTPLPVKISYTKSDPRTSEQILQPKTPDVSPSPATSPTGQSPRWWALVFAIAAALVIAAWAAYLWWRIRGKASVPQPGGAGFCPKCGTRTGSGDRFCSKCGAPLGTG